MSLRESKRKGPTLQHVLRYHALYEEVKGECNRARHRFAYLVKLMSSIRGALSGTISQRGAWHGYGYRL